jgi:hypothetical protein
VLLLKDLETERAIGRVSKMRVTDGDVSKEQSWDDFKALQHVILAVRMSI